MISPTLARWRWAYLGSAMFKPAKSLIVVPTALQNRVTKTMSVAPVGKQLKQKSNSLSVDQHHLPALDLLWASFILRVQLTSLLFISPGL